MDKRGLRAAIERIVEVLFGARLDALAEYPAVVVSQDGDGRLAVRRIGEGTEKIPAMTPVRIRWPVPGVSAKVKPGTRCTVAFEAGDPRFPYVVGFEGSGLTDLTIEATGTVNVKSSVVKLADGDLALARAGDPVVVNITPAIVAKIVSASPPSSIPIPGVIVAGSRKSRSG